MSVCICVCLRVCECARVSAWVGGWVWGGRAETVLSEREPIQRKKPLLLPLLIAFALMRCKIARPCLVWLVGCSGQNQISLRGDGFLSNTIVVSWILYARYVCRALLEQHCVKQHKLISLLVLFVSSSRHPDFFLKKNSRKAGGGTDSQALNLASVGRISAGSASQKEGAGPGFL